MEQTRRYRIGVVGAGVIGSQHIQVLSSLRHVRLAAVADSAPGLARKMAHPHGAAVYEDCARMLATETLDGVVVATPDPDHLRPVLEAAQKGCGILVEKPIATSLSDADAMIQACQEAGVVLLVGFVLRHEAHYVKLRQAVRAGSIGRMVSIFARRQNSEANAERLSAKTDPLTFLGIHDIDQILWLHAAPVRRVTAVAVKGALFERFGKPEVVFTTLEFADGAVAVVESGWSLPKSWANWSGPEGWKPTGSMRMDVNGNQGYLSLDFRAPSLVGVDNQGGWKFPETRHWPEVHGKITGALRLQMEHFIDCLAGEAAPIADGCSARRALAVVLAAQESLNAGRPVDVDL